MIDLNGFTEDLNVGEPLLGKWRRKLSPAQSVSRRRVLQAVPLAGAGIFLAGCTTGQLTEGVNAVVVAANLALSILEGTGTVPAAVVMLVQPYLGNVGQAVIDTNAEIQSMDTTSVKATKIAGIWAMLAQGVDLPTGTPATVATVIGEVVAAIKALLAIVGNGQLALKRAGASQSVYVLTRGDRRALGQLTSEAMKIKARAMALK